MRFAMPWALWLLVLVPVLALWLGVQIARRRRALVQFAGETLVDRLVAGPSLERVVITSILQVLAAALLILAAARPQWGATLEQVSRTGVDVVLAVDISESMLADDVQPSRLARAQEAAGGLLDRLGGNRVGLVAFAGSAGVLCPLTLDDAAVRMFLDALTPDLISYPGSSLEGAIRASMGAFDAEQKKYKVMVLLSDGEDQFERGLVEAAAKEAGAQGLVIHALGVGTPQGGPIALRDADGNLIGYKQDNDGRAVTTRLQEELLGRIAQITGGHQFTVTPAQEELDRIAEAIGGMDTKDLQARLATQYEERYQIPLAAALAALIADALIARRRRVQRPARGAMPQAARAALLAMALAVPLAVSPAGAAGVAALVEQGNRLYKEGHLTEALEKYRAALAEDPSSAAVHYNIGNVLYRQGQYDKAYEEYRQAFPARERDLAQGARYNAGNSHFARQQWKDAIENFREALRINPADRDAKRNLELALQKMQEEQQKQKKPDPREDDKQDQQQPQPSEGEQKEQNPQDNRQPQQPDQQQQESLSKQEAMRILDALRQQDRPSKDQLKVPPPDRKPERDW